MNQKTNALHLKNDDKQNFTAKHAKGRDLNIQNPFLEISKNFPPVFHRWSPVETKLAALKCLHWWSPVVHWWPPVVSGGVPVRAPHLKLFWPFPISGFSLIFRLLTGLGFHLSFLFSPFSILQRSLTFVDCLSPHLLFMSNLSALVKLCFFVLLSQLLFFQSHLLLSHVFFQVC